MSKRTDNRKNNQVNVGRARLKEYIKAGRTVLNNEEHSDEIILMPKNKKKSEKKLQPIQEDQQIEPEPQPEPKPKQTKQKQQKINILVDAMNKLHENQEKLINKFKKQKERKLTKQEMKKQIGAIPRKNNDPIIDKLRQNLLVKF